MANDRISQLPAEVVVSPTDAKARVSQEAAEVVVSPTSGKARESQLAVEAVILPTSGKARTSQVVVEVVIENVTLSTVNVHAQAQADIKQTYTDKSGQTQADIKATSRAFAQAQADIKQTYPLGSPYNQHVMSMTPWGYWRLGESSGTVAEDETGLHDGSYAGTPVLNLQGLLAGDPNKAASFATGTAYTETAQLTVPTIPAGNFSIALWFTLPVPDPSFRYNYLFLSNDWPSAGFAIGFYNNNNDPWYAQFYVTNGTNYPSSYRLLEGATGSIHFLVGTYDGTTIRVYLDGVLGQPDTISLTKPASGAHTGAMFEQTLDEYTVWDRVLTGSEIEELYAAGITVHGPTFGQAQATIEQVYRGLGQAQADIKATSRGYGQAQADIRTTYFSHAQAQADIKQTYYGLGQAQGTISATMRVFAQAQAKIYTPQILVPVSDITVTNWRRVVL